MTDKPDISEGAGRSFTCARSEPRLLTQAFKVKVVGDCQSMYGYARDISRSGMQIRTFSLLSPVPKEAGEKIHVEFHLPSKGEDIRLSCRARVVWNSVPPGGPKTITLQGIRFEDIEPEAQEKIDTWISGMTTQDGKTTVIGDMR